MDHQQKDETAVAYLATAMNTKLARARAKGRSGWDSPECTQQHLLREHVEKGDPVDVANFCAFLAARGEGIAPRQCLAQIEEPAQPVAEICSASHDDAQFGERAIKPLCDISGFEYGTPLYAGAAPAAVAPRDVVAWMHPETLNVISAAHKHDMSTEYGAETRRKAESYSVALVRAGEPAAAAPALEAPPGVVGRTTPRNDDERAAAQFFADNPSAAVLAWPLYLARDKSTALEAPAAPEVIDIGDGGQLRMDPDMHGAWRLFRGDSHIRYLDKFERNFVNSAIRAALTETARAPAGLQAAPVAGQSRFAGETTWGSCTVEHVDMVLAAPTLWGRYEVRYLYAAPQAPAAPSASEVVAGALFDFLGYLTTLPKGSAITFSSSHEATPAVEHLRAWAGSRNLQLEPADVSGWSHRLAAPAAPVAFRQLLTGQVFRFKPDGPTFKRDKSFFETMPADHHERRSMPADMDALVYPVETQTAPVAAPAAPAVNVRVAIEKLPRYTYGYKSDEWGMNSHLTSYKAEDGKFLRRDDVLSAIAAQAAAKGEHDAAD